MARVRDDQRHGSGSWLGTAMRDFPWVHLGIGVFGNLLFLIGSVMFFWSTTKDLGIWMFVIGSFGMFVGSLGEVFIRVEKHRRGEQ